MRKWLLVPVLLALLAVVLTGCGGGTPNVDWEMRITGAVAQPITITYADLVEAEQVTLEDVVMRRSQGEDTISDWTGPSVSAILAQAAPLEGAGGALCSASDGYAREMSLEDLEGSIIALKQDGAWIASSEPDMPLRLIVPHQPANHWVAGLIEIEVVE